jgi:hypothetical protein
MAGFELSSKDEDSAGFSSGEAGPKVAKTKPRKALGKPRTGRDADISWPGKPALAPRHPQPTAPRPATKPRVHIISSDGRGIAARRCVFLLPSGAAGQAMS